MANKTKKQSTQEEILQEEVSQKVTEAQIVEEVQENNNKTNPIVEEVLRKIDEKIQEGQPQEQEISGNLELDSDVQTVVQDFKDTSARLESIVKDNPNNIEEILEKELNAVEKAETIVEKALKEAEKQVPNYDKTRLSYIQDFGQWWNGSNSGL